MDGADHLERERLGERVRVARQQDLERVGQGIHAGRGRRRGRQADGQRRVQHRPAWQHGRMPDVVLAPRGLVGDDAVGVGLGAGPGGRRDRDDGRTREQVVAVVAERQDLPAVRGVERHDLGGIHRRAATDRDDDGLVEPERRQRRPSHGRPSLVPGFGSIPSNTRVATSRAASGLHDVVDDAGSHDPRIRHDERPGRTHLADERRAGPRPTRHRSARGPAGAARAADRRKAIAQDTASTTSRPVSRRTVSQRRQPDGVEPALGRGAIRVVEDPDLVEVAGVGVLDGRGRRPALAAERRTRRAVGGRSAGSRASASARPRRVRRRPGRGRARTGRGRTGRSRAGARPVAISSAMPSPPAGIALKPHVPQPVVMRKPSTPVAPMIGLKSAEMSQMPAHGRRIRICAQERQQPRDLVRVRAGGRRTTTAASTTAALSNSAPMSIWPRSVCDT